MDESYETGCIYNFFYFAWFWSSIEKNVRRLKKIKTFNLPSSVGYEYLNFPLLFCPKMANYCGTVYCNIFSDCS